MDKRGKRMLNVVETFSGIGAQVEALKNIDVDYKIGATVEWDIGAMYAYDIMHNGKQFLEDYRLNSKDALLSELSKFNLSGNGKDPLTYESLRHLPSVLLKAIHMSIERSNNKVDVSTVAARDMPDNIDVLTYSFPCQDLSIAGTWHHNQGGIDREANNRSSLLWQVERLLKDYRDTGKMLPGFLLMENVSQILSKKHIQNFKVWQDFLESLGYVNQVITLNARNFGVPQNRERTYMVSVLQEGGLEKKIIEDYFREYDLTNFRTNKNPNLSDFLRLNYANLVYRDEALLNSPNYTISREKIMKGNTILAIDDKVVGSVVGALTTKQDRHPNSGIVIYKNRNPTENARYRNITPREAFLLMGFKEESFDSLVENNIRVAKNRLFITNAKLHRFAGNSIVVPVLEQIFKQINELNEIKVKKGSYNLNLIV